MLSFNNTEAKNKLYFKASVLYIYYLKYKCNYYQVWKFVEFHVSSFIHSLFTYIIHIMCDQPSLLLMLYYVWFHVIQQVHMHLTRVLCFSCLYPISNTVYTQFFFPQNGSSLLSFTESLSLQEKDYGYWWSPASMILQRELHTTQQVGKKRCLISTMKRSGIKMLLKSFLAYSCCIEHFTH